MKKTALIVALLIIGIIGLGAFLSNSKSSTQSDSTRFSAISDDVESGAKLYDVRTSQEYAASHFENAENWSLQDMQSGKLPKVPKTTKIYVYCQSGNRSSQAAKILTDAGFSNVTDLGGLQDVQKIGGKL